MNTQIIIKKGPYVAIPKKDRTVATEDVVVTNKTKGKPFIAYPKSAPEPKEPVASKVAMDEGLYIAYPKSQQETQQPETSNDSSSVSRLFTSAEDTSQKQDCFNYRHMISNRFCPINFVDLFKMKAS